MSRVQRLDLHVREHRVGMLNILFIDVPTLFTFDKQRPPMV